MKLNVKSDCGNSPKKELVKNLTIYFASYDIDKVNEYLDPEVTWTLVGDKPILGRDSFTSALGQMKGNAAVELTIHSIVTHGREAAVHGTMIMEDGHVFGFSDFYEFTSANSSTVKSIISYVIQIS